MIPSNTDERARLARSRHLVPRLRASAQSAGMTLDAYLATLPAEAGRQAAKLVEYDDWLRAKDEAAKAARKADDESRTRLAYEELKTRHEVLERENESLRRALARTQDDDRRNDTRRRHDR